MSWEDTVMNDSQIMEQTHAPLVLGGHRRLTRVQAELSYKAGMMEAGIRLRAIIGGADEFSHWSEESLRRFRKETLQVVGDLLKEWGNDL